MIGPDAWKRLVTPRMCGVQGLDPHTSVSWATVPSVGPQQPAREPSAKQIDQERIVNEEHLPP